jgi:5-methylcytosine-specific restriction endonuclease McrA
MQVLAIPRRKIALAHEPLLLQLGIDLRVAHLTCWACGHRATGFRPQRAHIVPQRFGARPAQPWNYLLLCGPCHAQQPDASPWPVQLSWLLRGRVQKRAPRLATSLGVAA